MAQIDTSIYANLLRPPKSLQDYDNEAIAAQANRLALQSQQAQLAQHQRQLNDELAFRNALANGADDATLLRTAPTQAMALQKNRAEVGKETAQTREANSKADAASYELQIKRKNEHLQQLVTVSDVPGAVGWINDAVKSGELPMQQATQVIQKLQSGELSLADWRQKAILGGLDAKAQLEMTKPDVQLVNTGSATVAMNKNGYAPGGVGPVAGVAPIKMTATPGEVLQANTSRANNRDTIAAENMRAGVNPDGSVSPDMEITAKAIASGQLPAPTGMALLNPKNQRILARVMEINPEYDATTVSAKKKAASDFTSGTLGNSMRSFATAGAHLDTLGQLVDALDNGNIQALNKIGNYFSQQTGGTAPTNFDAAKDVVGKEVVKAIVAGGGGVAEREGLAKRLDNAKSPAQLKGVIKTYSELMKAQHDNLLIQRRAAGLPDSTLPDYSKTSGSSGDSGSTVPDDIQAILKKHGGK